MSIEADLTALYRAGRQEFPRQAALVARQTERLAEIVERINIVSAQEGDSAPLRHALECLDHVHDALRRSVGTLDDCSVGLLSIADDFVRTDAGARGAMHRIGDRLGGRLTLPALPDDNGAPAVPGSEVETTLPPAELAGDLADHAEAQQQQLPPTPAVSS